MKKSIISAIAVTAILSAFPLLQSCADTSSQVTRTTTSYPAYGYSPSESTTYTTTNDPGYSYSPSETTTTTTTRSDEHDSVVGATADAAGTIIEAPFRIVGDTLGVIF